MAVSSEGTSLVGAKVLTFPKGNVREMLEYLCKLADEEEMAVFAGVLVSEVVPGKVYMPMASTGGTNTVHLDIIVSTLEQVKNRYLTMLEEISGHAGDED
jgi:hypothetical protein